MPFDTATQTGAPLPQVQLASITHATNKTSTTIGTSSSYAAAAAGATINPSYDQGGASAGNAPDFGFFPAKRDNFYAQSLYPIAMKSSFGSMDLSELVPPDYYDPGISDAPRFAGLTWETPPPIAHVRWAPQNISHSADTAAGDEAAILAPGFPYAYWTGTVIPDGDGVHFAVDWVPPGSLPAAGWTPTPTVGTVHPDLAAGAGVPIPITDFETLDRGFVLQWAEDQRSSAGPPLDERAGAGAQLTFPQIYVDWDPGTYHYSYYYPPTAPNPVTFDETGHVTWGNAIIDKPGGVWLWHLDLIDVTTGESVNVVGFNVNQFGVPPVHSYDIDPYWLSAAIVGHGYQVSVRAADTSYNRGGGYGPAALSPIIYLADPNPDLSGTPGDSRIHFVD